MPEPLLAVRDIHTYYGDSYVLQGLSLELPAGRIVAILGRNGMGKTTLIRSVAGLTPPRAGDILFKGRSLRGRPPYAIAQEGIALVPQGRRIFRSLSVRENLLLPTSAPRATARRAPGRSTRVLAKFPQLAERIEHPGGALSGGEQQMLAVGRALMANPDLVLMDEPSEGLAPKLVQQVGGDHEEPARARPRGAARRAELRARDVGRRLRLRGSAGRFVFHGTPQALGAATDGPRSAPRRRAGSLKGEAHGTSARSLARERALGLLRRQAPAAAHGRFRRHGGGRHRLRAGPRWRPTRRSTARSTTRSRRS